MYRGTRFGRGLFIFAAAAGLAWSPHLAHADQLIVLRSGTTTARSNTVLTPRAGTDAFDGVNVRSPWGLTGEGADATAFAFIGGDPCTTAEDCPPVDQVIIDGCGINVCDAGTCTVESACGPLENCDGAGNCNQIVFLDENLTYLAGPENGPFETAFTPADFEAARQGQAPQVAPALEGCYQDMLEDPEAATVLSGVFLLDIPTTSALYAIDFEIPEPPILNASIDLYLRPNDTLGGGPNQGVYLNGVPLSGDTTGGDCSTGTAPMNIYRNDIAPLLQVGTNTLFINLTHEDGAASLLFTAEIRIDQDGPHTVHVMEGAAPGGDGTSWGTAYGDLHDALDDAAASLDPNREIWLTGGVYRPSRLVDPADPRSMTFQLLKDVDILGGFDGTERSLDQRRVGPGTATIITGDINGDDVFLPTHPTWNENAYHLFTGDRFVRRVDINNVTLTHAKASGLDPGEDRGSAFYLDSHGELAISQCHIDDNYSEFSGTIYLESHGSLAMIESSASGNINNTRHGFISAFFESRVSLTDCDFVGNRAAQGGVVSLETGSSLVATDCTFSDGPDGGFGGVIEAQTFLDGNVNDSGIHITLTRCDFLRNRVRSDGGAIFYFVSGAGHTGSLTITDCTFDENVITIGGNGGAIFATNDNTSNIPITVTGSTFSNNFSGGSGGAIDIFNFSSLEVTDCDFISNRSRDDGAAVNVWKQDSSFRGCSFVDNRAGSGDGALSILFTDYAEVTGCSFIRNAGREFGGALLIGGFSQSADIVDCVFLDNTCEVGRGGAISTLAPDIDVVNSLFVGNNAQLEGGAISTWDTFLTLTNSTVYGNSVASDNSGGLYGINSYLVINNSIIRGNTDSSGGGLTGQIDGDATTASDINFSNVEGVALSDGNIDEDAMFNDVSGADGIVGSEDDDLRLSPASPCIDAGSNALVPAMFTTDLDGFNRFVEHPAPPDGAGTPIVDMGTYEARFADCDHDGTVTLGDYENFEACMEGPLASVPAGCPCLDLDTSDTIDLADYATLQNSL